MTKKIFLAIKMLCVLGAVLIAVPALAAWSDVPAGVTSANCPVNVPGCNTPINVSGYTQTKVGVLNVGGLVSSFPAPTIGGGYAAGVALPTGVYTYRYTVTINGVEYGSAPSSPFTASGLINKANVFLPGYNLTTKIAPAGATGIKVYRMKVGVDATWYLVSPTISLSALFWADSGVAKTATVFPSTAGLSTQINNDLYIKGTTPGVGKVLTSDATGLATWQTPSPVSSGPWVTNGLNIYNNNTGNVGIGTGTAVPIAKLDVRGQSQLYGNVGIWTEPKNEFTLDVNGSSRAKTSKIIGKNPTDPANTSILNFDVTGQSKLYGNVGIWTEPKNEFTLDVNGSSRAKTSKITGNNPLDTGNKNLDVTGQSQLYGNVGIWTEPKNEFTLDVNGKLRTKTIQITGGSPGAGKVLTSDASGLATWQTPVVPVVGSTGGDYWSRSGGAVYPKTITDEVGIGTTNPRATLHVVNNSEGGTNSDLILGDGTYPKLRFVGSYSTPPTQILMDGGINDGRSAYIQVGKDIGDTDAHLLVTRYGTPNLNIKSFEVYADNSYFNGVVKATNFIKSSDISLKKNVLSLDNALGKVLALRGVSFGWKDSANEKGTQIGLIAQEVEKVYPEIVSVGANGKKGVDYSALVAPLIEAVKEQQKQINELKIEIETLKTTR